jgi:hypothetical protein
LVAAAQVPEPATLGFVGFAVLGLSMLRRQGSQQQKRLSPGG